MKILDVQIGDQEFVRALTGNQNTPDGEYALIQATQFTDLAMGSILIDNNSSEPIAILENGMVIFIGSNISLRLNEIIKLEPPYNVSIKALCEKLKNCL